MLIKPTVAIRWSVPKLHQRQCDREGALQAQVSCSNRVPSSDDAQAGRILFGQGSLC